MTDKSPEEADAEDVRRVREALYGAPSGPDRAEARRAFERLLDRRVVAPARHELPAGR